MFGSMLPRRTCAVLFVACAFAGVRAGAQERQRTVLTRTPAPVVTTASVPSATLTPPTSPLASARTIFVDSESEFCNDGALEERLLADKRFGVLGYGLTRDVRQSDVVIKVNRTPFTTHFTFTILDRSTSAVLASGRANSLFGTASGRIAKRVIDALAKARGVRK